MTKHRHTPNKQNFRAKQASHGFVIRN